MARSRRASSQDVDHLVLTALRKRDRDPLGAAALVRATSDAARLIPPTERGDIAQALIDATEDD